MEWIVLILVSTVSIALARLTQKTILNKEKVDSIALSIVFQALTAVIIAVYAFAVGSNLDGYQDKIPNIIFMILMYSAFNYFLFKAFKLSQASTVSLILASSTIWTIVASIIFLHERPTALDFLGIFLILVALILVNRKGLRNFKNFQKGELFAILAAMFVGIALTNDFYVIGSKTPFAYAALTFMSPAIFTAVLFNKKIKMIAEFAKPKIMLQTLLLCIFYATSLLTLFAAYQSGGKASELSPIHASSVIIVVVLSAIFLKERSDFKIKIIAAILAVLGIALTAI